MLGKSARTSVTGAPLPVEAGALEDSWKTQTGCASGEVFLKGHRAAAGENRAGSTRARRQPVPTSPQASSSVRARFPRRFAVQQEHRRADASPAAPRGLGASPRDGIPRQRAAGLSPQRRGRSALPAKRLRAQSREGCLMLLACRSAFPQQEACAAGAR